MKRTLIAILLALALVTIPVSTALADTTQDVTITADPHWSISITNSVPTWPLATVEDDNTTYWWATFVEPLDPAEGASVITNNGTVMVDITITGDDFTTWTLVQALPGVDEVEVTAWAEGYDLVDGFDLTTGAQAFIAGLDETLTADWTMRLITADTFVNATSQTGVVTLTAAQSP